MLRQPLMRQRLADGAGGPELGRNPPGPLNAVAKVEEVGSGHGAPLSQFTLWAGKGARGTARRRDASGGSIVDPPEKDAPTLSSQGVDKHLADSARKAAALSKEEFEAQLAKKIKIAIASVEGTEEIIRAARATLGVDENTIRNDNAENSATVEQKTEQYQQATAEKSAPLSGSEAVVSFPVRAGCEGK